MSTHYILQWFLVVARNVHLNQCAVARLVSSEITDLVGSEITDLVGSKITGYELTYKLNCLCDLHKSTA